MGCFSELLKLEASGIPQIKSQLVRCEGCLGTQQPSSDIRSKSSFVEDCVHNLLGLL